MKIEAAIYSHLPEEDEVTMLMPPKSRVKILHWYPTYKEP